MKLSPKLYIVIIAEEQSKEGGPHPEVVLTNSTGVVKGERGRVLPCPGSGVTGQGM